MLWGLLALLLIGLSIKAAAEVLLAPYPLESLYHLLQRLRRRLDTVRTHLCLKAKPPPSSQRDPLWHSAEHLKAVFAQNACPVSAFQRLFQVPLLG